MVKEVNTKALDTSTEEKIKSAARIVFQQKGFAATRTRDIAEEAGVNLALLNYYFLSKEKLFNEIILESITQFRQKMFSVFEDESSTLEQKIEMIASNHINFYSEEPELPIFLLSEVRFAENKITFQNSSNFLKDSVFIRQFNEAVSKGEITEISPIQFFINLMSLITFPFIYEPLYRASGVIVDKEQFDKLIQDRKKLIPVWIKAMLSAK